MAVTVPRETEPAISPYLEGNYAPIHSEITAENLEVIGELPDDLAGMFIRTGSNPRFHPNGRYHWFDGDGMLHGLEIEDGSATYRNRYIRTKGLEDDLAAGALAAHRHHGAARRHQPGRPLEGHREHGPRLPLRQAARALVAVRQGAPDPAARPRDRGAVRLRRHARHEHGLARQGRSRHRRDDLHRLRPAAALPALRRRVAGRRGGALDADRAARLPAPARRRHHREPRAAVRHVDDVGSRGAEAGPRAARLLPRPAEPHRRDPAPRRGHATCAGSRPSRSSCTTRSRAGRRATRS